MDVPLFLRIANELYLKRLIVGGFDGVFEFGKDFRNEGMSRFHNTEFTQCEFYVAYKDYLWMMDFIEGMFNRIILKINDSSTIICSGNKINFKKPWKRYTMYGVIKKFTGIDVSTMDVKELIKVCKKFKIKAIIQFYPLYRYHFFKKRKLSSINLKNTDEFYDNMISFPFHHWMSNKDFKYLKSSTIKALEYLENI